MAHSDSTWYLRQLGIAEKRMQTRAINGAFCEYLKRFGASGKNMKARRVNGAFLRYLKRFGTAELIVILEKNF